MKKLFFLLAFVGFMPSLVSAEQDIAFACNYFPPQKITPPNESDHPGYDVEILAAVIGEMGHKANFEFFPWNRAYEIVKTGQKDALCSCSYLPERDRDFIFSEPMGTAVRGVFYLDKSAEQLGPIVALSSLQGKKVAVVRGYNLESELHEAGVKNVGVVNTDKLLLNLLLYKRVDFIYSYESTILFELKQLTQAPKLEYKGFGETPYHACFSRRMSNNDVFVNQFNSALRKIKQDGRYQDIMSRYRIQ